MVCAARAWGGIQVGARPIFANRVGMFKKGPQMVGGWSNKSVYPKRPGRESLLELPGRGVAMDLGSRGKCAEIPRC